MFNEKNRSIRLNPVKRSPLSKAQNTLQAATKH